MHASLQTSASLGGGRHQNGDTVEQQLPQKGALRISAADGDAAGTSALRKNTCSRTSSSGETRPPSTPLDYTRVRGGCFKGMPPGLPPEDPEDRLLRASRAPWVPGPTTPFRPDSTTLEGWGTAVHHAFHRRRRARLQMQPQGGAPGTRHGTQIGWLSHFLARARRT